MIQFTNDNWEHKFERVNGILALKKAIFRKGDPKNIALKINFTYEGERKLKVIKFSDFITENDADGSIVYFPKLIKKNYWIDLKECENIVFSALSIGNFDFILEFDMVK